MAEGYTAGFHFQHSREKAEVARSGAMLYLHGPTAYTHVYLCPGGAMRRFAMTIDDGLLRAAKSYALNTGMTVSETVRDSLARAVGWFPGKAGSSSDDAKALPVLRAYSERRMSRRQAMDALGLTPDRYPDFADAMNRLSVPWPRIDPAQIDQEAEIVVQAIQMARDAD